MVPKLPFFSTQRGVIVGVYNSHYPDSHASGKGVVGAEYMLDLKRI